MRFIRAELVPIAAHCALRESEAETWPAMPASGGRSP